MDEELKEEDKNPALLHFVECYWGQCGTDGI